jgi:hypothetical protein
VPEFIPGIQLNEAFYWEAVRPVLDARFSPLAHSAALIGYSSDVLGYDTPVSRDHGWGPRLMLFLPADDFHAARSAVDAALRAELPVRFRGYSTNFSAPDLADGGTRVIQEIEHGPVDHMVLFYTVEGFVRELLGADPFSDPRPAEWLTFTEQRLLELTAGKVYHDGLRLEAVRQRFAYYPREVWLYLLAAQWTLIAQEEAFAGRTWQAGDALGSRVVTARLVERLMRLCFLMEKRYAPYSKWFGTAFSRLDCAARMGSLLEGALSGADYPAREPYLAQAYSLVAEMHNGLGITAPLETRTRTYSGWHALREGVRELALDDPRNTRPHQVIFASRFVDAILAAIRDPQVRAFPHVFGSVSQFLVESSDAQQSSLFCSSLLENLSK